MENELTPVDHIKTSFNMMYFPSLRKRVVEVKICR